MAVKIVTDSTSYIPKKYIEKYDIKVISLNVVMNGESRREVDIDNKLFYDEMNKLNEIPKSAQPSPNEVLELFKEIIRNGDSIIGIFLSAKMSGTFSTASMVREMVLEEYSDADIQILDSGANCMQMGFAVIEGAIAGSEGKTIEEVIAKVTHVFDTSRFLFTPETLEYLKKGGRIGGASAMFGSMLKIKPILTIVDGETSVFKKVRTRKKSIDAIVAESLNDIKEKGLGDIIVHHINCEEDGTELARRLEGELGKKVEIQSIGPVIGLHVGPGSIGVSYYTKS